MQKYKEKPITQIFYIFFYPRLKQIQINRDTTLRYITLAIDKERPVTIDANENSLLFSN